VAGKSSRNLMAICAGACVVYGVGILAYVATAPDLRLHCLLINSSEVGIAEGVEIRSTQGLGTCKGMTPSEGDVIFYFDCDTTVIYTEYAQALADLRARPLGPGEILVAGSDPHEVLAPDSTTSIVQIETEGRLAKVLFQRRNDDSPTQYETLVGWAPLQPQPLGALSLSLLWYVLQLGITLIVGIAYWQRPYDRPLRAFWGTSFLALVAFLGGNHWWVISGTLSLLIPFVISSILMPAVLLDFFLHFPSPKSWLAKSPRITTLTIYLPAGLIATGLVGMIICGAVFSGDWGEGPLAAFVERYGAPLTAGRLQPFRGVVSLGLGVAGAYFALSVLAMVHGYIQSRRFHEHEQLRWMLWAGIVSILPVGYILFLAWSDRVAFSFGGSQVPMLITSLLFMLAYVVGIVRHRLFLIDQSLNRGVLYYVISFGATLLFSMAVAFGSVATLHREIDLFGHPILIYIVLSLAVMLLVWLRDRLQRGVDREFFREKYRLDKSIRGLNQAVTGLLDRRQMADRMLASCQEVLHCDRAAIYLRDPNTRQFKLLTDRDDAVFPDQFEATRDFISSLGSGMALQRVRSGTSPLQLLMRSLDADLICGLDVDGALAGAVVLGPRGSDAGYTAEDVTYLSSLGRVAGVSLHFGKVHEDLTQMNSEFSRLGEEINRRAEQSQTLEEELRQKDELLEQQRREVAALQQQLSIPLKPKTETAALTLQATDIKGSGTAMGRVLETVRKVAASPSSVLIRGESGTGKELLARALHENSSRREQPLISVHCAALSPGVLESELFGHVKGAFTDARNDKPGRFQLADRGTLFLDEIGDVPPETQVKLLRALQERVIEPVGGTKPIPVDVRLIAATHQNLEKLIAEGRFREDLYYRLNVISIPLPPLRERGSDIVELAVHFLRRGVERSGKAISHFDEQVLEQFHAYSWPGNIRELENVVERAVVLAESDHITLDDLPPSVRQPTQIGRRDMRVRSRSTSATNRSDMNDDPTNVASLANSSDGPALLTLASGSLPVVGSPEERAMLIEALHRCDGNKTRAAELVGMPRSTFFSKLKKHEVD